MTRSTFIFIYIIVLFTKLYTQEIHLEGIYNGTNLYVLNPSIETDSNLFCVKAVYVNNMQTADPIASNAFEIDFSLLQLKEGEKLNVRILHLSSCKPLIINPNAIKVSTAFSFTTPRIDRKNNELTWSVEGTIDSNPFLIEQFKWDKWVIVEKIYPGDSITFNNYRHEPIFHSNRNVFRIRHVDKTGFERISREVRFIARVEDVNIISNRVSEWIYFTKETQYEIYDEKGFFITEGYGKDIDIRELDKGRYWINFDNKTEIVVKR